MSLLRGNQAPDIPGGTWTVPFGREIGQISRLEFQPIN
jgi:hypothetical protein